MKISPRTGASLLLGGVLIALLLYLFAVPVRRILSPEIKPNVVLIVLDAARADHLSTYGYKKNTTPHIDEIARDGAVFLRTFAQGTHTYISVPSYLSSRYYSTPAWGVSEWDWNIRNLAPEAIARDRDPEQVFLPEIFAENGYRTALFHDHACFTDHSFLVSLFDESYSLRDDNPYPNPADREIIKAAIAWMEKNRDRNFFLYCHIMSPHEPYPPKEEDAEFLDGREPGFFARIRNKMFKRKNLSAADWNEEELSGLIGLYDSNLKHTDRWVGVLADALAEMGLAENTLLIITADHGENLGQHDLLGHGFPKPYDSVTHVPMIMRYPNIIPAGIRVSGRTELVDLLPTIIAACGISLPPGKKPDGMNMLSLLSSPDSGKDEVFTRHSIRADGYLYFTAGQLYDLTEDPDQTQDIAGEQPETKNRLQALFRDRMAPYQERYNQALRTEPPDFPFYTLIHEFVIEPENAFETCSLPQTGISPLIKKAAPRKPWLLNTTPSNAGLFSLPGIDRLPELTISMWSLPDGIYRVSILLQTEDSHSPSRLAEHFRITDKQTPGEELFLQCHPVEGHGAGWYYLDLGNIRITDRIFKLTLNVEPDGDRPIAIRHLRFIPEGLAGEIPGSELSEEKRRKTRKSIETLGYL